MKKKSLEEKVKERVVELQIWEKRGVFQGGSGGGSGAAAAGGNYQKKLA